MVLSDGDILEAIEKGELCIEHFDDNGLTPNGYDLRVETVLVPGSGAKTETGQAVIPPKSWFLVGTRESVRLGRGLVAQLWLRTTFARKGVLATFGKIDAGFEGTLTVSAFNASDSPVQIPVGERFCQMVLERLDSPARKVYAQRSGRYQGQTGITLSAADDLAREAGGRR
jgi:dCTP deaminase